MQIETNECQHCINPKSHRIKINSYDNRHSHPGALIDTQYMQHITHTCNCLAAITTTAFCKMHTCYLSACVCALLKKITQKTIPLQLDLHPNRGRYNIVFFSISEFCSALW